jgi:hypothetical protein
MRCRVPSTSAAQEMVPKQKTAPGLKVIMLLKTMAMESALIDDDPLPGTLAVGVLCPTTHPGLPLWCFWVGRRRRLRLDGSCCSTRRETPKLKQVRAALRGVIPYFLWWFSV